MTQPVTVLYFAWLRERTGTAKELIALPEGVRTVADLLDHLTTLGSGHASALQNRATVRAAVNQEFADPATPVQPGDEVALFPPVTGG
jgi:molybdopterin synthase sulfur carrier subunit